MKETISGNVIRILNDREIVLNKGTADGLQEGDYIGIVDPQTQDLLDPITNENLGGIRRYKVALRVTQLADQVAIAATYRTREIPGKLDLSIAFGPRVARTEVERLRLAKDAAQPIPESESRVQAGDKFDVISKETAESRYTLVQLD